MRFSSFIRSINRVQPPSLWRLRKPLSIVNNLHREVPRWTRTLKSRWKLVSCLLLLGALASFGAVRGYQRFRRQRVLSNAALELRKGNPRGAALFASSVLQHDPDNVAACKILAEAESGQWPAEALHWYARVEQLQPGDVGNGLAWARTALRVRQPAMALQALAKIPAGANRADYQALGSQASFALGDMEGAEKALARAASLDPGNRSYRIDLAELRLLLPGPRRAAGLAELESDLSEPKSRARALRALSKDAEKQGEGDKALDYAAQLRAMPEAVPKDRLHYLELLLLSKYPAYASELRSYQSEALRNIDDTANLAFWMNENNQAVSTIAWLTSLPANIRASVKIRLALAQSYVALRDWDSLKALAGSGDWKDLDFLRVAMLARALREQGDAAEAADQWNLASLKAQSNPESLELLCKMAFDWGWRWNAESEDLAWKIAEESHPPKSVLHGMSDRFAKETDAWKMYRLVTRIRELDPADRVAENNFALLSLLLHENEAEAQKLALDLYQVNPEDGLTTSTYAFSLYTQGQTPQALEVMRRLSGQLRIPSVAAYYCIFLTASGEREQARTFARLADTATLLPEEKTLLLSAEDKLKAAPPESPKP